jgi:importin subunit alpha-1
MSIFGNQDAKPKGAKQSLDVAKGTERRLLQAVSLRKDKRNEMLEKKRRGAGADEKHEDPSGASMDPFAFNQQSTPQSIPLNLLPAFFQLVVSNDPAHVFHGTLMIRKLLSVESNPPIDEVIATGVVPLFVSFMDHDDFPELQFEAAWALTNIASGTREHTHLIISSDSVPRFIRLLQSPSEDCREQGTWAIGNLAGEGDKCRDYVLGLNVMPVLLGLITTTVAQNGKITILRNAVWALSNLCRSKPQPKLEQVAVALPVLASLLNHPDDEVVVDAAWAVSYISDGPADRIQAVIEHQVVGRIVQLLSAPTTAMQTPAIRTIGNIATGNDRQTQIIINAGALPPIQFLLNHQKRAVRKEACWTVSNITAGHRDQVQAVINADLFPSVLNCMRAPEFEVKKEAVWAVANTTAGGSPEQMRYLLEIKVLAPLCELLCVYDPKIVVVALEALQNLLHLGEQDRIAANSEVNLVAAAIIELGGFDQLEKLQSHTNSDVYNHAYSILETYFPFAMGIEGPGQGAGIETQQSGFEFSAGGAAGSGGQFSF